MLVLAMKTTLALLALTLLPPSALAGHLHPESYYQKIWCDAHQGEMEVVLADGTRADCITSTHAVEFDFAKKWAESIGQALNYSSLTGKRCGIVLIGDGPKIYTVRRLIRHYRLPCDVWVMPCIE